MASKIKVDQLETADGSGTIALQNQLSGMTNTSLPSGAVLQMKYANPDCETISIATASWTRLASSLAVSITPIYSDSILEIECFFMFGGSNSSNITHFKIHDDTNGSDVNISGTGNNRQGVHGSARQVDADINDCDMMTIKVTTTASNTNARSYSLYAKNESGTTEKTFFGNKSNTSALGYAKPYIKVTEYKA